MAPHFPNDGTDACVVCVRGEPIERVDTDGQPPPPPAPPRCGGGVCPVAWGPRLYAAASARGCAGATPSGVP